MTSDEIIDTGGGYTYIADLYHTCVEKILQQKLDAAAIRIAELEYELTRCAIPLPRDDGWVTVDEAHPVPDKLRFGDEVRIKLAPVVDAAFPGKVTHYRRRSTIK